jgi:hypothetical protein
MIATAVPTNEKPKIGKCMTHKLWYCVKDYVIGWGTTPKGAYAVMDVLHKQLYRGVQK